MKKIMSLLIVFSVLAAVLAGCKENPPEPPTPSDDTRAFSGYCIEFSCPKDWKLYSVEEKDSLVGKAVLATTADEQLAIKLFCGAEGVSATVLRSGGENTESLGKISASLKATVSPEATYNNIKMGIIKAEELIEDGEVLPLYAGTIDTSGIKSTADLARTTAFDDGTLAAVLDSDNGRWGFVNKKGEYVIAPQYDFAGDFSENVAAVALSFEGENPLWGYIGRDGSFIEGLEPQFLSAGPFSSGLALVSDISGAAYYIDKTGGIAITAFGLDISSSVDFLAPGFAAASDFKDGRALVAIWDISHNAVAYLINSMGFVMCQVGTNLDSQSFDSSFSLSAPGYVMYKTDGGYCGICDELGVTIVNDIYDTMEPCFGDTIAVSMLGRYGYITPSGMTVLPLRYEGVRNMTEKGTFVKNGHYWELVTPEGATIYMERFEDASALEGSGASVMKNGFWAIFDTDFGTVTPYVFSSALEYKNGVAWFIQDDLLGCVNTKGEVIIEPAFVDARSFS